MCDLRTLRSGEHLLHLLSVTHSTSIPIRSCRSPPIIRSRTSNPTDNTSTWRQSVRDTNMSADMTPVDLWLMTNLQEMSRRFCFKKQ